MSSHPLEMLLNVSAGNSDARASGGTASRNEKFQWQLRHAQDAEVVTPPAAAAPKVPTAQSAVSDIADRKSNHGRQEDETFVRNAQSPDYHDDAGSNSVTSKVESGDSVEIAANSDSDVSFAVLDVMQKARTSEIQAIVLVTPATDNFATGVDHVSSRSQDALAATNTTNSTDGSNTELTTSEVLASSSNIVSTFTNVVEQKTVNTIPVATIRVPVAESALPTSVSGSDSDGQAENHAGGMIKADSQSQLASDALASSPGSQPEESSKVDFDGEQKLAVETIPLTAKAVLDTDFSSLEAQGARRTNHVDPGGVSSNAEADGSAEGVLNAVARLTHRVNSAVTASSSHADRAALRVDGARFVSRVAHAFQIAQERGGILQLRLSPPELGSLRMEVSVQHGVLTAKIDVDSAAARHALLDNLPVLRERLAEQNIRIERFDVDVRPDGGNNGQSFQFDDGRDDQPSSTRQVQHAERDDSQVSSEQLVIREGAVTRDDNIDLLI